MKLCFQDDATEARTAMVASFDLVGFSDFCRHPDAAVYIPRLVSSMFKVLDKFLVSSLVTWWSAPSPGTVVEPSLAKFTGDGALLIWINALGNPFKETHRTRLVEAMRAFQAAYKAAVPDWESKWQVSGLPKHMRVGISTGTVYPVYAADDLPISDPVDYVGYCINLAVRLQNHYPEIGFIVQKAIGPDLEGMTRLKAHHIKGAHDEEVLVFESERKAAHRADADLYASRLQSI